jgi:hypothetical protein
METVTTKRFAIVREWGATVLSYASGGPTVVLALFYIVTGAEPPKMALLGLLGVCSVVAAWVGLYQERQKRILEQTRQLPSLRVVEKGFYETKGQWMDGVNATGNHFSSLELKVVNDPEVSSERSRATEVAAILTFRDDSGTSLFEFEGRWTDSTQPSNLPRDRTITELSTVNIPIGTTRLVGVAIKYLDDGSCYGVTNRSYTYNLFKNPAWELKPGVYSVSVRFRSALMDQRVQLRFKNPEGPGDLIPLSSEMVTE